MGKPATDGCKSQPVVEKACCRALTAPCLACAANTTEEEYCRMQPSTVGCKSGKGANACCEAMTAKCLACAAGLTEEEFCVQKPATDGCKSQPVVERVCCRAMVASCLACQ